MGFISAWVAFNGWLSNVVGPECTTDAAQIHAIASDSDLIDRFRELRRTSPSFQETTDTFAELWPVFDVRRLEKARIKKWDGKEPRRDYAIRVVGELQRRNVDNVFKPYCDHTKQLAERVPPVDWPHTIFAVYQVRCNLFHGGKSFSATTDLKFIHPSLEILWEVWGRDFIDRR